MFYAVPSSLLSFRVSCFISIRHNLWDFRCNRENLNKGPKQDLAQYKNFGFSGNDAMLHISQNKRTMQSGAAFDNEYLDSSYAL